MSERHEFGEQIFKRVLQLFRVRQPKNFKLVWERGLRPRAQSLPFHRQEVDKYPYTGGRSLFEKIGRFTAHLSNGHDGKQLWVGHHSGPGVLIWDPDNDYCQCIRDEEAKELFDELNRLLVLEALADV